MLHRKESRSMVLSTKLIKTSDIPIWFLRKLVVYSLVMDEAHMSTWISLVHSNVDVSKVNLEMLMNAMDVRTALKLDPANEVGWKPQSDMVNKDILKDARRVVEMNIVAKWR